MDWKQGARGAAHGFKSGIFHFVDVGHRREREKDSKHSVKRVLTGERDSVCLCWSFLSV
jgi:hypothetical protein